MYIITIYFEAEYNDSQDIYNPFDAGLFFADTS